MQRTPDRQKLRSWEDCFISFDCGIEHAARINNHIVDALSSMYTYLEVFFTKDDLMSYSVGSTTIRLLQEITSTHINLSDHSTTLSTISKHPYHNLTPSRAVNVPYVDCDLSKYRGRGETTGHYHSCLYLDEENTNSSAELPAKLSGRGSTRCLQMKNLCHLFQWSFLRSTKPSLPMSI